MVGKRLHPENFPWDDNVGWINHIFEHETNDELPYKLSLIHISPRCCTR